MLKQAEEFLPTGFPGFQISSVERTLEAFGHELSGFQTQLPGLANFIELYAPCAVKLKRCLADSPAFSSAAYPECPHLVFYTELIRFHLPPNIVWSANRKYVHYPVLENLVHESVHHWWGGEALRCPQWAARLQTESIKVSWRREAWSLDKAIHAGLVYLAAQELRTIYCAELADGAQRAATEIFQAVPPGPWTEWANRSLGLPEVGYFLNQLGLKNESIL